MNTQLILNCPKIFWNLWPSLGWLMNFFITGLFFYYYFKFDIFLPDTFLNFLGIAIPFCCVKSLACILAYFNFSKDTDRPDYWWLNVYAVLGCIHFVLYNYLYECPFWKCQTASCYLFKNFDSRKGKKPLVAVSKENFSLSSWKYL